MEVSVDTLSPSDSNIEVLVLEAQSGNVDALNRLLPELYKQVYAVALRFLYNPHDAEDACQEIIIRIVKNLSSFKGDSQFRTWSYRVAFNTLISIKSQRKDETRMDFGEFSQGIAYGQSEVDDEEKNQPDFQRLLEEIRIACTLATLQCLDDDSRLVFILGEILEMDHSEASDILSISPENYRKRLSRARQSVISFMSDNCGLVNEANACRCHKQVNKCLAKGCVSRNQFLYSKNSDSPRQFPEVLRYIRSLSEAQRAAALYRQLPAGDEGKQLEWLQDIIAIERGSSVSIGSNKDAFGIEMPVKLPVPPVGKTNLDCTSIE